MSRLRVFIVQVPQVIGIARGYGSTTIPAPLAADTGSLPGGRVRARAPRKCSPIFSRMQPPVLERPTPLGDEMLTTHVLAI